ncbi:hypothetical protein BKA70DRAFT_624046 [Coprinopsis sp. MPI-PUGE-AT-0042]|nr:hypothetical protein BKA70DRAFT_624046 [Coprinopsis sp. MPI-PUGE-AT-0042]
MAQVTLTLRPPPNVDFVHGFPGIPPAQDRPQAVVKGALEIRLPPGTPRIKAKWVRIELRKIEQLPFGGPDSQFFDFVGQSPLNLWTTPDEYGELSSQDFPFAIRIPESIPPSVELDNRGQISYELVASICTKGKKGFLRKAKAVVKDAKAPITIDKHELHSTWPIYCQYEIRHTSQEGLTLTVERNQSCFGPGDRIAVTATVKSDAMHTVVITGFELALKEVTRLHPNNFVGVKRVATKLSEKFICSQRMESNATLYGGSQATVDLYCTLNPSHTTPTLTSARHMDINYICIVKAHLQTGGAIVSEIPVMISNWPRSASAQAIKQIGPTLNLSLGPALNQSPPAATPRAMAPLNQAPAMNTLPAGRPSNDFGGSSSQFGTAPSGFSGRTDEFGRPTTPPSRYPNGAGGSTSTAPKNARLTLTNAPEMTNQRTTGRPGSSGKPWLSAEDEKRAYEEARNRVANTQGVEAAPLPIGTRLSPPAQSQGLPPQNATGSGSGSGGGAGASGSSGRPWLTAEEEKVKLYQKAQEAALKHQDPTAFVPTTPGGTAAGGSSGGGVAGGSAAGGSGGQTKLTPAELYRQAMEATQKNAGAKLPPPNAAGGGSGGGQAAKPQYPSAEQEKRALRLYEDARRAVDRTHGDAPAPVAYGDLYPNPPPAAAAPEPAALSLASSSLPLFGSAPIAVGPQAILSEKERLRREYEARDAAAAAAQRAPPPPANEPPPPPFSSGPAAPTGAAILSEKERLRREYEARDAAAAQQQKQQQQAPPPFTPSPPPTSQYASAIAEKEALRRKFEERDRMASAPKDTNNTNQQQQQQPLPAGGRSTPAPLYTPRSPPTSPSGGGAPSPRPIPNTPPAGGGGGGSGSGSRILTAAEEKALLKAKYEAKMPHRTEGPRLRRLSLLHLGRMALL